MLTRSRPANSTDCDEHLVWVAMTPGEPGAHASCVDEPPFREEWAAEEMAEGSTLLRVTCNQAHAMLKEYREWCDNEDLIALGDDQGTFKR